GAVIHRLGPVVPFPLIANLRFVAAPEFAGQRAEEDATVQVLAMRDHVDLEDEIIPLTFRLQIAVAVPDVEFAVLSDGELRLVAGNLLPAGEVFAVEDGFEIRRFQFDTVQGQLLSSSDSENRDRCWRTCVLVSSRSRRTRYADYAVSAFLH